jgi:hypothetical protein
MEINAEAVLLECVWLLAKPQLKTVRRLASVIENRLEVPGERDRFWHTARVRLGKLHRARSTRPLADRDRTAQARTSAEGTSFNVAIRHFGTGKEWSGFYQWRRSRVCQGPEQGVPSVA